MAYTIKGNLDASGNITAGGKNTIRSINDTSVADVTGNINITIEDLFSGDEGDVIYFDKNNDAIANRIVKYARIVDNERDLALEKSSIYSFSDVFNNWKRISIYDKGVFPAKPSELNDWIYKDSTDQIECTINTETLVGFVSPEKYNNYTFDVALSSQDLDDDWIGVLLAYSHIDGKDYTITAMRRSGNTEFSPTLPSSSPNVNGGLWTWRIIYNFTQGPSGGEYVIADGSSGLSTFDSWRDSGLTKVRSVRSGNIITASTTNFKTPNTYTKTLTVDLTSDPRLEKFINPSNIGYVAYSQALSTYKNITFTGGQNVIYDSSSGGVWVHTGSQWMLDAGLNMYDILSEGIIYANSNLGKAFFVNGRNDTRLVAGTRVSMQTGNTLQSLTDGLYVGSEAQNNINQYVDSINGSDSNDGSITRPLKTVKAALDKLIPGVKGYNISLHNKGTYTLPNQYYTKGVGVSFYNYPAPSYVDDYITTHPWFQWMAVAGIPRPTIKMDTENFVYYPGQGWNLQSLIFTQYGELSFYGCIIEAPPKPAGDIYREGMFGDDSQVVSLKFQWCDIRLGGIRLLNERIESSSSVVIHRCIVTNKTGKSFATDPKVLKLSVSGLPSDEHTTYPEHPYFNNSTLLTDIRNSVSGVKYYNGIPTNCNYQQLFGGPY